jgi:type II secretory pathway pseudopilin PulG
MRWKFRGKQEKHHRVIRFPKPTGDDGVGLIEVMAAHNKRVNHSMVASAHNVPMSARRQDESGFALIEVVVAFTLLVVVFFAIEYGVAQTTTAGVEATQLATETSLANQAIVQAEALPFADLQAGANPGTNSGQLGASSTLVNWRQLTLSGSTYTLTLNPTGSTPVVVGTVLDTNAATSGEGPVVPFVSSQTIGNVKYKVAVFTTSVTGHPTLDLVRVTAIVERVLASSSNPTSTPCPNTPASSGATVTMCGAVAQQVMLGAQ